jgi:serine/threonine protein kinase
VIYVEEISWVEVPMGLYVKEFGHGETYAMKIANCVRAEVCDHEIVNLAGLHHPNVMHLICCAEEEHNGEYHCQYVTECMDKPLSLMLQEDWRHPQLIGAVDVMLQVAEGMKYLHSLGFAHRDLKLDNILMKSLVAETYAAESSKSSNLTLGADPPPATNNQAFWIAKICDFGTSKVKMETRHKTLVP